MFSESEYTSLPLICLLLSFTRPSRTNKPTIQDSQYFCKTKPPALKLLIFCNLYLEHPEYCLAGLFPR